MQIISQRFFGPWIVWRTDYEWEDVFSRAIGIPGKDKLIN